MDELCRLTAVQAVALLKRGAVSPLELIEAAAARIAAVEPMVNALPTLCPDRARAAAGRLGPEAFEGPGSLAGLPVSIKDLMDVAGVRTTYGSPIFRDHVPAASHPLVQRIERRGGLVLGKSNTPEFGAGGNTFNPVFGRTLNPWNTALTCGGSTGGGAVSVATGEVWLAQGSDHGGSLRRPATYNGVVGLRPSVGRVTRGSVANMFSPLSVQGPMGRTVADVALFLDTMAGLCPHDPLTLDAPGEGFADALTRPPSRLRIAWSADFGGQIPVDRETRERCAQAVRRFEDAGCTVEEASPALGAVGEAFLALRSQHFVVDRELLLQTHRDQLKPDIVWNTERGLAQTPSHLAWAERERAAFFRRMAALFETYDVFVLPGSATPAFDVALRFPATVDGVVQENYMAASLITSAITMTSCPAVSVPCGLDGFGRPIGLQIVAPPRRDALALQAAALFETVSGAPPVPIDPRPGVVPGSGAADA